jgi:Holliday junction resolvase RusA-like endonuclease
MLQYTLTIDGTLPNLNDYLAAERQTIRRGGRFTTKGNDLKQTNQEYVIYHIRQQLKAIHITSPVYLKYCFYEPNRKRDKDNISAFAHKVIQDALVKAGVLDNDGWANITGFCDAFNVDKIKPRIEVIIVEEGD